MRGKTAMWTCWWRWTLRSVCASSTWGTSSRRPWGAVSTWSPAGPSSPRCGSGSNRSSSMPKRDPDLLLEDILGAVRKIARYTSGMDEEQFRHDDKTVDAVVRNLEIIGEA